MNFRQKTFDRYHGLVRTSELLASGDDTETIRWASGYRSIIRVRQGWWILPGTPEPLHVEVPVAGHGAREPGVVVHWSRDQRNGDRRAVSVEVARRQASRCRVANGTL